MYIKRKNRIRLLILAVIVLLFLFWRGIKVTTQAKGMDCQYKLLYAVCTSKGKPAILPGWWEILKAGAKF